VSEHHEQVALFDWARAQEGIRPELGLLYAIPNGQARPWSTNKKGQRFSPVGQKLRAEGVQAGVPDVHLPVACGGYHGLWIEMKFGTNKPTESQQDWIGRLRAAGHRVEVCYSFEEARAAILRYLDGISRSTI